MVCRGSDVQVRRMRRSTRREQAASREDVCCIAVEGGRLGVWGTAGQEGPHQEELDVLEGLALLQARVVVRAKQHGLVAAHDRLCTARSVAQWR